MGDGSVEGLKDAGFSAQELKKKPFVTNRWTNLFKPTNFCRAQRGGLLGKRIRNCEGHTEYTITSFEHAGHILLTPAYFRQGHLFLLCHVYTFFPAQELKVAAGRGSLQELKDAAGFSP